MKRLAPRRGFTTLLVIAVVAVGVITVVAIQASAFAQAAAGREAVARTRAKWAARAGIESAIAALEIATRDPETDNAFHVMDALGAVGEFTLDRASVTVLSSVGGQDVIVAQCPHLAAAPTLGAQHKFGLLAHLPGSFSLRADDGVNLSRVLLFFGLVQPARAELGVSRLVLHKLVPVGHAQARGEADVQQQQPPRYGLGGFRDSGVRPDFEVLFVRMDFRFGVCGSGVAHGQPLLPWSAGSVVAEASSRSWMRWATSSTLSNWRSLMAQTKMNQAATPASAEMKNSATTVLMPRLIAAMGHLPASKVGAGPAGPGSNWGETLRSKSRRRHEFPTTKRLEISIASAAHCGARRPITAKATAAAL